MWTFGLVTASAKYGSRKLSLSVEIEGHRPCAKKQQNLVPGARFAPFAPQNSHCQWQHEGGGKSNEALRGIGSPGARWGHSPPQCAAVRDWGCSPRTSWLAGDTGGSNRAEFKMKAISEET